MWDLTVPGNNDHDFYIQANDTAILVHNAGCGSASGEQGDLLQHLAQSRADELQSALPEGSSGRVKMSLFHPCCDEFVTI
jgi:hypothetical protein